MTWNRRDFIWAGGATLAVAALGASFVRRPGSETLEKTWLLTTQIDVGAAPAFDRFAVAPKVPTSLCVTDLRTGHLVRKIAVQSYAHSWVQSERDSRWAWGITKGGSELEFVDLRGGRAVELITAPDKKRFFGHALARPNGELWVSAHDDHENIGEILVYRDNRFVEARSTFGQFPHEMHVSPDGRRLVVANLGWREKEGDLSIPSLTWIDLESWTLARRSVSSLGTGPAHFQFLDGEPGSLISMGLHPRAAVEIFPAEGGPKLLVSELIPPKSFGSVETLNVAFDPRNPGEACIGAARNIGTFLRIDWRKRTLLSSEVRRGSNLVATINNEIWASVATDTGLELRPLAGGSRHLETGNGSHLTFVREA